MLATGRRGFRELPNRGLGDNPPHHLDPFIVLQQHLAVVLPVTQIRLGEAQTERVVCTGQNGGNGGGNTGLAACIWPDDEHRLVRQGDGGRRHPQEIIYDDSHFSILSFSRWTSSGLTYPAMHNSWNTLLPILHAVAEGSKGTRATYRLPLRNSYRESISK